MTTASTNSTTSMTSTSTAMTNTATTTAPIARRYDFVLLFDVMDGNPNGDPDNGNAPRIDPETGHGIVTDVAIKRKIRNYVTIANDDAPQDGRAIYVTDGAVLNRLHQGAYDALGLDADAEEGADKPAKGKAKGKASVDNVALARDYMTRTYFDVRTFGAVMSTGVNAGQVLGPVQLTCARSVDPIAPMDLAITRMAVASEAQAEKQSGNAKTIGRKHIVPYGLYVARGFVSAHHAAKTGFSDADLGLLWESLLMTWDHDHSASRGMMSARGLYVFEHESKLGNAPAAGLLGRITAKATTEMPREFSDYAITVNDADLPAGVKLLRKLG